MESGNRIFKIARVGLHRFEEPCLSGTAGSGTVFFSGCNLRCAFCQNYRISRGENGLAVNDEELLSLFGFLEKEGAHNINLVTPSIWTKKLIPVLKEFKKSHKIPIVWNSSGYESVEDIRLLEGLADVFLPDFKYSDDALALEYSGVRGYRYKAFAAISEMRRQQPADVFDENGIMQKGVIVRHLVLPAATENTRGVLRALSQIDDSLYVSLMSQYFPTPQVAEHPVLGRRVTCEEYDDALNAFFEAGLKNGFSQDPESATEDYVPDFDISELAALLDCIG